MKACDGAARRDGAFWNCRVVSKTPLVDLTVPERYLASSLFLVASVSLRFKIISDALLIETNTRRRGERERETALRSDFIGRRLDDAFLLKYTDAKAHRERDLFEKSLYSRVSESGNFTFRL